MYMNKIFGFLTLIFLAGCVESQPETSWFTEYGTLQTGTPIQMQYGSPDMQPGTPSDNLLGAPVHRMAVMLPLSGDLAPVGRAIQTSVEIAVLQNAPRNLSVAFYDTASDLPTTLTNVLMTEPEVIIGPVFANDARTLRDAKPETLPVLSFTSDATAIGDGVMSMALLPTNSVETIVQEMSSDGIQNFIILAPDTETGRLMAGTALGASDVYGIPIVGVFYYTESDSESIKSATYVASMNNARTQANNRARAVLSDILTQENLGAIEKSSLSVQLDRLSKMETLGDLPYDAVLFLGNGDDTESLASFLRYYGVNTRDARFYGTALWDGSDIVSDITMAGAKYAVLPELSPSFSNLYEQMSGTVPGHLAGFGYDATNMAMGMIYSTKSDASYLLDPSGYAGVSGLYRLKPTGENERALQIVQLTGDGTTQVVRSAPTNFLTPIYNLEQRKIEPADAMELETPGINPDDYINIPARFRDKYRSETYGTHITAPAPQPTQEQNIIILPEDDRDPIMTSPDFQPINLETVGRTYIDSVEIEE